MEVPLIVFFAVVLPTQHDSMSSPGAMISTTVFANKVSTRFSSKADFNSQELVYTHTFRRRSSQVPHL